MNSLIKKGLDLFGSKVGMQSGEADQKMGQEPGLSVSRDNIFFLHGHQRSGTNWLENILNLHPKIACNGEFYFKDVQKTYLQMLKEKPYSLLNQEPLKSESLLYMQDFFLKCMQKQVEISHGDKKDVVWYGARTPRILKPVLIKGTPIFFIYRDGRDVLISLTYFNLRLNAVKQFEKFPKMMKKLEVYKEDPFYYINNPAELLDDEDWVRFKAKGWNTRMSKDLETKKEIESGKIEAKLFTTSYENLHADLAGERTRAYEFLGLDPAEAVEPSEGGANPTKAGFKKEDPKGHNRKGQVGDWKNYFTQAASKWYTDEAGDVLVELGYEKDHNWTGNI